jgi:hypothetical protein
MPERIVGALLILVALSACQMTAAPPSKPKMTESPPPNVAARAATSSGKTAVVLNTVPGRPGQVVTLTATLNTSGASVAGTQNDISFDPKEVAIAAKSNGKPDCAPNSQLGKEGTAFSFLPPGCNAAGGGCTSVRALVLSLSNTAPIPNGSPLYTCQARIAPQASPGAHTLSLSRVGFSSPSGQAITGGGVDGAVTVGK